MADATVKNCQTEFYKSEEKAMSRFLAKLSRGNGGAGNIYTCILECENGEHFYAIKLSSDKPSPVLTDTKCLGNWIKCSGNSLVFHKGDAGTVIDQSKVFI